MFLLRVTVDHIAAIKHASYKSPAAVIRMRNDHCASRSDKFSVFAVLWLKSRSFLSVADCTHNDFQLRVSDNKNLFEICIRIRVS